MNADRLIEYKRRESKRPKYYPEIDEWGNEGEWHWRIRERTHDKAECDDIILSSDIRHPDRETCKNQAVEVLTFIRENLNDMLNYIEDDN